MSKNPRVDQDLLHRRAQVAVLAGLLRGDDIDALVEAVAPSHVRGWFTPDVAVLELAVTALAAHQRPSGAGAGRRFHVVCLGQAVVDDVRRRRQQETLGRRGHREDPLYCGRRLLRRGFTTLNQRQWSHLELTLTVGDPSGQLTSAWTLAQEEQLLYDRSHDVADAKHRLWRILDRCARADVPELLRLARTLDAWTEQLLAYWTPTGRRGVSNGPTEATNALIKKVQRVGHGFPQLPAAAAARRRSGPANRALAGFAYHPDPRPLTPLGGVEPDWPGLAERGPGRGRPATW